MKKIKPPAHKFLLRMDQRTYDKVKAYCEAANTNVTDFLNHAAREMLAISTAPKGESPVMRAHVHKLREVLPDIDMRNNRRTIVFHKEHETNQYGDYFPTLGVWLPLDWSEFVVAEAERLNSSPFGVVMSRIRKYMTEDDVKKMAEEKGWPLGWTKRYLINHVFPELPYCEFGTVPVRRLATTRRRKE